MRKIFKQFVKSSIKLIVDMAAKTASGRYFFEQVLNAALNTNWSIQHKGMRYTFAAPNGICRWRIETFSKKEPETLEWIDGMEHGSVVWDIGANVGLYSCYAAKCRGCTVVAFEPSVFNLELLARNIFLNGLSAQVVIVPLPLAEQLTYSTLNMSTTEWGGAMSTFGESYTHDGSPLVKRFEFRTLGLSMDEAIGRLELAQPDYIKMDVDGIEHLILKGGSTVLSKVKGVLIEINEEFAKQTSDSFRYLSEAGLELVAKRHSAMFADTIVFNQIWRRAATR
jgi:FkbM family methyltransferase